MPEAQKSVSANWNDEQLAEMSKEDLVENYKYAVNSWKKTAAELVNHKRRSEQEKAGILEFAKELTVMKLMPSLQSLEQVLAYAPSDEKYKDWLKGLKITIMQLEKTMEELGVVKIKTVGEQFDPTHHEAVEEVEGQESGKIIKEIQPGFMLNNKLIIPAKVAVGKEGK